MAAPAPPLPSLASLPLDLLAAVISFIPLRPRLSVLSLVSRRFLLAVRHSVRSCTGLDGFVLHVIPPRSIGLFTNLTSLHLNKALRASPPPPALLARVQSLTLDDCQHVSQDVLCEFRSLTTLEVRGITPAKPLLQFVERHASSLTSLAIRAMILEAFEPREAVHLPRLTSFVCRHERELDCFKAPALTHLSTSVIRRDNLRGLLQLPTHRLTSLSLDIEDELPAVYPWLISLTRLTRLELSLPFLLFNPYSPEVYSCLSGVAGLASLSYSTCSADSLALSAALAHQTRLGSLSLPLSDAVLLRALGTRLTAHLLLPLADGLTQAQFDLVAAHLTNLEKLTLFGAMVNMITHETRSWPLLRLRTLKLLLDNSNWTRVTENLARIVSAYPSLRRLYVRRQHLTPREAGGGEAAESLYAHCALHRPDLCVYFVNLGPEFRVHVARLSRQYPWLTIVCCQEEVRR